MSELTDYDELRDKPSLFVEEILGLSLFSYQEQFVDSPARKKAFVSGRQVGKTLTAAAYGLHGAVTSTNSMVLITAPSQRQSALLFKELRGLMNEAGISDETWGVTRDTQTIIEFDNGSEIHCLPTGRDGSNIRGYTADMIIVDESAFIDDTIFEDVLYPMTFSTNGDFVLLSTPWGTSGYFYRKTTKWATEDTDGTYSTWDPETEQGISSKDNPLNDDEDIEEFKEGKTKRQIKQEVLGAFVEDGAQFIPTEAVRSCQQDGVGYEGGACFLGADIAAAGADETVFTSIDNQGNVFDIEAHGEMGVLQAAQRIKHLDRNYDYQQIVVDRTGLGTGTAEQLAEWGEIENRLETVYFSVQTKQTAYQSMKAELEAGNITIPQDRQLRNQLTGIGSSTTKTGNLSLHAKGNGHDDYVDSLALGIWALPDTAGNQDYRRGATTAVTISDDDTSSGGSSSSSTGSSYAVNKGSASRNRSQRGPRRSGRGRRRRR